MPLPIAYPLLTVILAALAAIGPFSIDTYLPAFPAIEQDLGAQRIAVQQTLSAYLATFSAMVLWHGTLSDAFGRRRVLFVAMLLYGAASLVCALAPGIGWLWAGRALQGVCAGAGTVVGRAVVRDLLEGAPAQRLMSHVMMVFALAPAVAPMVGGLILELAGWRAIFVALAAYGFVLAVVCRALLPESLPPERRQPLHPRALLAAYRQVLLRGDFVRLCLANSLNFAGFFIYVLSAPAFLLDHLGLGPREFAWFFVPGVAGMVAGSVASARQAGQWSRARTVALGYAIMLAAAALNLALAFRGPPALPWPIAFVPIYTFGMALSMPSLSLMALELFDQRKGLAASCQGFLQMAVNALVAALLAPLAWASTPSLALASGGLLLAGLLLYASGARRA